MQKGLLLLFPCTECGEEVTFDLNRTQKGSLDLICQSCSKEFLIEDENFLKQILSFLHLTEAIKGAEDILSSASIAVRVGDKEVKIPYKLLLTRFTSNLDIEIGGKKVTLTFRSEPLRG